MANEAHISEMIVAERSGIVEDDCGRLAAQLETADLCQRFREAVNYLFV